MTPAPNEMPSGNGSYPRVPRALVPFLGEEHPRSLEQTVAFSAVAGHRADDQNHGPPVAGFALVLCAPQLHGGQPPVIGAVWTIGGQFHYLATVPDVHVTIPAVDNRRDDFTPVEHEQWVWPLTATEVDALRAYCPRHHQQPLWLDRARLLEEVMSIRPGHAGTSYVQLLRVVRILE